MQCQWETPKERTVLLTDVARLQSIISTNGFRKPVHPQSKYRCPVHAVCCMLLSLIILNAPIASLVPLPFLKPYWSSPKQLFVSALDCILFVRTLSTNLDACVSRLIVLWSSHGVAFGLFFISIGTIMVCKKSSRHDPMLYMCA